jgi:hypothetical protein
MWPPWLKRAIMAGEIATAWERVAVSASHLIQGQPVAQQTYRSTGCILFIQF